LENTHKKPKKGGGVVLLGIYWYCINHVLSEFTRHGDWIISFLVDTCAFFLTLFFITTQLGRYLTTWIKVNTLSEMHITNVIHFGRLCCNVCFL